MERTVWIQGLDINDQPVSIEVPESLGNAIKEAIANAHKVSTEPDGAAVYIELPQAGFPNTGRIAIAPDRTPVAVIDIRRSHENLSPYFTVAIDIDANKVVGPLASRFKDLSGHTTNLVLRGNK